MTESRLKMMSSSMIWMIALQTEETRPASRSMLVALEAAMDLPRGLREEEEPADDEDEVAARRTDGRRSRRAAR